MIKIWIYLICFFVITGYCGHRLTVRVERGEEVKKAIIPAIICMLFSPAFLLVVIGGYLSAGLLVLNDKILKDR